MELSLINEFGYFEIKTENNITIGCIQIIGEIEGHNSMPGGLKSTKYEHLIPLITSAAYNPKIKGLLFILHTTGGDVDAGLAISELISTVKIPTVSLTLGTSHSIGIPIALSTDLSLITDTGLMLAHPVRMSGTTLGGKQSFEYINKLQDRIIGFIVNHSNISENTFKKLIYNKNDLTQDIGSMINGPDSVKYGLIDKTGGIDDAIKDLEYLILHKSQN